MFTPEWTKIKTKQPRTAEQISRVKRVKEFGSMLSFKYFCGPILFVIDVNKHLFLKTVVE